MIFKGLLLLLLFFTAVCWASPMELKRIEQARFLFEMEGQSYRAIKILESLDSSSNQTVLSRSQILLKQIKLKLGQSNPHSIHHPIQWSEQLDSSKEEVIPRIDIGLDRSIEKDEEGFFLNYPNQSRVNIEELNSQCNLSSLNSRYVYFKCSNSQLVQINLSNPQLTQSNNISGLINFIPLHYGGYIVTSDKIFKLSDFQDSPEVVYQGNQIEEARITDNSLIIRTSTKIIAIDRFSNQKKWIKNNVQGELIQHKNKFGIIHPSGYIQMFKEGGEFLWRVHLGKSVRHHQLNENMLKVSFKDSSLVKLEIDNTQGFEEWTMKIKELGSQNLSLIDSLLEIEPGNLILWQRKVENLQSSKGKSQELAHALNTSLRLSREMDNPKSHLLEDYNQTIGAHWVRDLEISSSFYPQILNTSTGPTFIHSNTGKIHRLNPSNGEDILISADSIESRSPIVELPKDNGMTYTIHKNQLQIRNSSTLKLLKTHDFKHPLKTLTPTPQGLAIEDWNNHLLFFDTDQEIILWMKKLRSSSLGTFYRPRQKQIITILDNGMIHINNSLGNQALNLRIKYRKIQFAKVKGEHLYISTKGNRILQISLKKMSVNWEEQMESQVFSLQVYKGRVLVGLSSQKLIAHSVKSGKKLWHWEGKNSLFVKPSFYSDKVYLDQGSEMIVLKLQTGKKFSGHYYPTEIGPPQVIKNKLYLASRSGILHSFNLK